MEIDFLQNRNKLGILGRWQGLGKSLLRHTLNEVPFL